MSFTCKSCLCVLPNSHQLKTKGYCYLCDPNIKLEELLSPKPIEPSMKAAHAIKGGVLNVTATLPSGKEETKIFILQNLLQKCTSILHLEFKFTEDGEDYYYHI